MAHDIYQISYELKDLLINDERIIKLNNLEKQMNENTEVMALSYQKDVASLSYNDALKYFPDDSKEVKDARHRLFLAKEQLDNHPLVKEYLQAYNAVRDLYFMLNEILFSQFSSSKKEN